MTKETIVFVPGLLCNEVLWENQMKFFHNQYDCIVADITQHNNIQDMVLSLNEQVPEKFHLIGFSLGGWVALEFAQLYPEKISTLTTISSDAGTLKPETRHAMGDMIQQIKAGCFEALIADMFAISIATENKKIPHLKNKFFDMMHIRGPEVALRQLQALLNFNRGPLHFDKLQMPIKMIHGQQDVHIDVSGLKKVTEVLSNGQLECIQFSGHFVPLENPHDLNKLLPS